MKGKKRMWRGCAMGLCAALVLTGLCACGGNGDGDGGEGTATTVSTTATTAATATETTTTTTTTTAAETPATAATTAAKAADDPYQVTVDLEAGTLTMGGRTYRQGDDITPLIDFLGEPEQQGYSDEDELEPIRYKDIYIDFMNWYQGSYVYVYPDLFIIVRGSKNVFNHASRIIFRTDKYEVNGVRVGDTEKKVISLFSDPKQTAGIGGGYPYGVEYEYYEHYYDEDRGDIMYLEFYFGERVDTPEAGNAFHERGDRADSSEPVTAIQVAFFDFVNFYNRTSSTTNT